MDWQHMSCWLYAPTCSFVESIAAIPAVVIAQQLYQQCFSSSWPLHSGAWTCTLQTFTAGMAPALVQLLVVFPLATSLGVGGLGLGMLTPLFVILYSTVGWSMPGLWWFDMLHGDEQVPGWVLQPDLYLFIF